MNYRAYVIHKTKCFVCVYSLFCVRLTGKRLTIMIFYIDSNAVIYNIIFFSETDFRIRYFS